jgi:hypothetical protein
MSRLLTLGLPQELLKRSSLLRSVLTLNGGLSTLMPRFPRALKLKRGTILILSTSLKGIRCKIVSYIARNIVIIALRRYF